MTSSLRGSIPLPASSPRWCSSITRLRARPRAWLSKSWRPRALHWHSALIHDASCSTSNNKTLCATEILNDIQSQVGTITKDNIQEIASEIAEGSITLGSNVTCTDCTKAMYNLVEQADPSVASTYNSTVVGQCGASFTSAYFVYT